MSGGWLCPAVVACTTSACFAIVVIIMIAGVTSLGPSAGGPWGVADHADSELRLSAGTRTYCQCGCSKLANDDRSYHVDSLATVTQADDSIRALIAPRARTVTVRRSRYGPPPLLVR
jgi:hypothetical protein